MHIDFISIIPVIASTGCLTRAAEALDVSPSTIHKRLKKVEEYYQADIFIKSNGKLRLTNKGEKVLAAINNIENINQSIIQEKNVKNNTVHIGINQGFASRLIRDILSEELKNSPDLNIRISTITDYENIRHFKGHFLIITIPFYDPEFSIHTIGELTCYFVASLAYLEQHGEPQTLEDLSQHNLITTSLETFDDEYLYCQKFDGSQCKFLFNSSIYTDSKIVSDEFIFKGNGIGLMPHTKIVARRPGNIKVLFNGSYHSKVIIQAGMRKHNQLTPSAKALMDLIAEKLDQNYL